MSPLNIFYRINISQNNKLTAKGHNYLCHFNKLLFANIVLLTVIFSPLQQASIVLAAEQATETAAANAPIPSQPTTVLSGKILPRLTAQPYLPFTSVIEEILVEPGQAVEKGQNIISYKLNADALRAIQKEILLGANTEGLRAQILDARQNLSTLGNERAKISQLVKSNLAADRALLDVENSINHQRNKISLLQSTLNKATANFKIRLNELSEYYGVKITSIEELPEILYLKSIISGNILNVAPNLYAGTEVKEKFVPMQIANLDTMVILVQVYETELNSINVNDKATIQIPSLQNREFEAIVSRVSWLSSDLNVANPSFFTVELEIPNPSLELRPGFKAIVHFK